MSFRAVHFIVGHRNLYSGNDTLAAHAFTSGCNMGSRAVHFTGGHRKLQLRNVTSAYHAFTSGCNMSSRGLCISKVGTVNLNYEMIL
jgi:hypothetical protein